MKNENMGFLDRKDKGEVKKFYYFDEGDKTSFQEGDQNIFSYNPANGEVSVLEEGWEQAKGNPNLFLKKSFNYLLTGKEFETPFKDLFITPAIIDKNGKIVKKGEIKISTKESIKTAGPEKDSTNGAKSSEIDKKGAIESNYKTIGYADVILEGKLNTKFISTSPREDTVYEILQDSNGAIKLGVWKGAEKRVLNTPDFIEGTDRQRVAKDPTLLEVELGDLQKNDEGGYTLTKKPKIILADEEYKKNKNDTGIKIEAQIKNQNIGESNEPVVKPEEKSAEDMTKEDDEEDLREKEEEKEQYNLQKESEEKIKNYEQDDIHEYIKNNPVSVEGEVKKENHIYEISNELIGEIRNNPVSFDKNNGTETFEGTEQAKEIFSKMSEELKNNPVAIENKEEEEKISSIKEGLNEHFDKKLETENENIVNESLKLSGIDGEFLETTPGWENLSTGEKLLVLEQSSQDTLSRVKELGEQRFLEKNKISFSKKDFNPLSFTKKIWNNISKAYWISKEEKQVLKEIKSGEIKPNEEMVKKLIERTAEMHLNVIEKDGKAIIQFINQDESLPEDQRELIAEYNEAANEYARMPDSWKNERSAKSTDGFIKNNHNKYKSAKNYYEAVRDELLEVKIKNYEYSGISRDEAERKAMLEIRDNDFDISILQFMNTNPDAVSELKKIEKEISYGRLLNNENIWRGIYMGAGYTARSISVFASTFGIISAPLIGGTIGAIRARRKANEKINLAFNEGRQTETFKERKENGKNGLFDDKNKNRNFISNTLSGKNINAKEVGSFIDADSQIQRLDNIIQKIDSAENSKDFLSSKDQLLARVNYIEDKHEKGLINYGTKDAIGRNYELLKKLSYAQVLLSTFDYNDVDKEIGERRDALLEKIMENNRAGFIKNQTSFKDKEMIRGAVTAAGFSLLGWQIREWINGGNSDVVENTSVNNNTNIDEKEIQTKILNNENSTSEKQSEVIKSDSTETKTQISDTTNTTKESNTITSQNENNQTSENIVEDKSDVSNQEQSKFKEIKTKFSSKGAIKTIEELQAKINTKYPDKVPVHLEEFAKADPTQMAIKLGLYNPEDTSGNESAILIKGSTLGFNENGDLSIHDIKTGEDHILIEEKGTTDVLEKYDGRMVDADHSGTKIETNDSINEDNTNNLNTKEAIDQTQSTPEVVNLNETEVKPVMPESKNLSPEMQTKPEIINTTNTSNQEITPVNSKILVPEYIKQINDNNLKHLFPNDEAMAGWNRIKTIDASTITNINKEEVSEILKPLVSYTQKLQEITKTIPREPSLSDPTTENISDYLKRATKKAIELGYLEQIKL